MDRTVRATGMVLSAVPMGEYDKRVVLLTKERGKISAFARGARRQNSPLLAGTSPFAFGEFELYEGRTSYTLVQARISNYFRELAQDVEGACYGFYFLELADYYGRENADELPLLKLLYQTMRALMRPALDRRLVRRVFELKAMAVNGEQPEVFSCVGCGEKEALSVFSAGRGGMVCPSCAEDVRDGIRIGTSALYALQYIVATPVEKLYTFQVAGQVLRELGMVMNRHMERYVDKKFKTLDILHMMVENIL